LRREPATPCLYLRSFLLHHIRSVTQLIWNTLLKQFDRWHKSQNFHAKKGCRKGMNLFPLKTLFYLFISSIRFKTKLRQSSLPRRFNNSSIFPQVHRDLELKRKTAESYSRVDYFLSVTSSCLIAIGYFLEAAAGSTLPASFLAT